MRNENVMYDYIKSSNIRLKGSLCSGCWSRVMKNKNPAATLVEQNLRLTQDKRGKHKNMTGLPAPWLKSSPLG